MTKLGLGAVALMVATGLSVSVWAAADSVTADSVTGTSPLGTGPDRPVVVTTTPSPTFAEVLSGPPSGNVLAPASSRRTRPTAARQALRGHGELAIISGHRLFLTGSQAGRLRQVHLPGWAATPTWSPDGKWLTVAASSPPPATDRFAVEPAALWLVSRRGQVVRRLTAPGVDVESARWSPTSDVVAVVAQVHGHDQALVLRPGRPPHRVATSSYISGLAWSPEGTSLAVSVDRRRHRGFVGELETMTSAGRSRRVVTASKGNVLVLAGWRPDGAGLIGWLDYMGSGSIAADGLPLFSVPLDGGRRTTLSRTMLTYQSWLSASPGTGDLALVAGGDRELTLAHKHLVVCRGVRCDSLPQPRHVVTFDPAYGPGGRLVVVRDRAVDPARTGGFGSRYLDAVDGSGTIEQVLDGGATRAVRGVGRGAFAPMWGRDGSLLFFRHRSLWLLPRGRRHAHRVVGPISVPSDYYGFVPWGNGIAWTDAFTG